MIVADLANLGGISGRHRIKVARLSSFHEDLIRGFLFRVHYHIELFHRAETRIHRRCCDSLGESQRRL